MSLCLVAGSLWLLARSDPPRFRWELFWAGIVVGSSFFFFISRKPAGVSS